jgi:hypothetical protein
LSSGFAASFERSQAFLLALLDPERLLVLLAPSFLLLLVVVERRPCCCLAMSDPLTTTGLLTFGLDSTQPIYATKASRLEGARNCQKNVVACSHLRTKHCYMPKHEYSMLMRCVLLQAQGSARHDLHGTQPGRLSETVCAGALSPTQTK